ncbi:hypothetical protein IGI04_020292, partial [Brassica rapa subsp. trilocularis]
MEAPAISDSSEVGSPPVSNKIAPKGNWVRAREEVPVLAQLREKQDEQGMTVVGENEVDRVLEDTVENNMVSTTRAEETPSITVIVPKELEWSDVSPGKASRSPMKLAEPEQVLTTSRFSVLALEEDEEKNEDNSVSEDTVQEDEEKNEVSSVQEGFVIAHYRSRHYRAEHLITIDKEILRLRARGLTDEDDV